MALMPSGGRIERRRRRRLDGAEVDENTILLVSLPHTPQGLSPIGSNRHCVVGRDPRAPANKNEIN